MRQLLTILMSLAVLTGLAHADEVHLTTGRSVQGTVIEENADHVVVKTPKGKVTLPRRLVKSITRQDKARTWLALADERLRAGALEEASRLYEKAAKSKDAKVARKAREGLAKAKAARARRTEARIRARAKAKTAGARRSKATAKPSAPAPASKRTVWGYDDVRAALRKGEAKRAQVLLTPLLPTRKSDPVFQYLLGRAKHLQGSLRGAYGAYRKVVNLLLTQRKLPPIYLPPLAGRLEELARRSFGEALRSGAPGIDDEWLRVEVGDRFAIYHKMDFYQPVWGTPLRNGFDHFQGHLKAAHEAVMKRLGVSQDDLGGKRAPRVIVFLFPSSDAHAAAGGSGHARHRELPDGWLHILDAFQIQVAATRAQPGKRRRRSSAIDALKHKVAHTILRDAFALPPWTEEAASAFLSAPGNADRAELLRVGNTAKLPPARDFLTHKVQPAQDATRFDAQGLLIFRALIDLRGSLKKALALCEAMRKRGAERALADVRLTFTKVERACRKLRETGRRR